MSEVKQYAEPKFQPGQQLQHVKTGGYYKVVCLAKIEATLEDAYVYQAQKNMTFWIRPKREMEDGRFVLI